MIKRRLTSKSDCSFKNIVDVQGIRRIAERLSASTGCTIALASYPGHDVLFTTSKGGVCEQCPGTPCQAGVSRSECISEHGWAQEATGLIQCDHGRYGETSAITVGRRRLATVLVADAQIQPHSSNNSHNGAAAHAYSTAMSALPMMNREQIANTLGCFVEMVTQAVQSGLENRRLKQETEKYRAIFNDSCQFMGLLARDGTILEINRAFLGMAGLKSPDVAGKRLWDTSLWDHSSELRDGLHAAITRAADGQEAHFESTYPLHGKDLRHVDVSIMPIRNDEGDVVFLLPEMRDITAHKHAEKAAREQLHFLASLEHIDSIIRQTTDMEQMIDGVIKAMITLFDCDRAWLLYPCDPDAATISVPVQHARPEYSLDQGDVLELPMTPGYAKDSRDALASKNPVSYTEGTTRPVDADSSQQFGVRAMMFTAIYPKTGKPWTFGMHQCSYARIWTKDEERLFKEIGRRIADGLSSTLLFGDLRTSQERLALAMEGSNSGLWDFYPQTQQVYYDPKWFSIIGYEPDELPQTYETWTALLHPDDRADTLAGLQDFIEQGKNSYSMEFRMKAKDGSWQWISSRGRTFERDPAGMTMRMAGTHTVITARKHAEEALEESEVRYRTLFESANDAIEIIDGDVFIECNSRAVEFYGCKDKSEIIGHTPIEFSPSIQPDGRDSGEKAREFINAAKKGHPQTFYWRHLGKQGVPIDVEVSLNRLNIGDKISLLAIGRDITERKRAEEALRNLRNYLSNIIDSMPSVLVGVDSEGRVTQWNRSAEQETGVTVNTAAGRRLEDVFPRLVPEMDHIRIAIRDRRIYRDSKRTRPTENGPKYEDLTIFPLMEKEVEGAVIRLDDTTERVRLEKMMIQSEKMLSIGGLAAGIAHEINNPLAGMMQTAELLLNRFIENTPANKRAAAQCGTDMAVIRAFMQKRDLVKHLRMIHKSGMRAAKIVKNILSFARKGEGGASPTDLCELLDNTVPLVKGDFDIRKKYNFRHVEIVREYQQGMPPVSCEASKIQQVFFNILKNGTEAMKEQDRAEVNADMPYRHCFFLRITTEGAMARVEIEDNGPGMNASTLSRIFEPFFTTKDVGAGTGLGLSVSYFIITEDHDGTLEVESRMGKGTKFIIRLPFKVFAK